MIIQHLRNIVSKIKVNPVTYVFILLCLYNHTIKIYLLTMLFVFIHELCHLAMAFYFGYTIESVVIYPFGTCGHIKEFLYKNLLEEICIIMAGPISHIFIIIFLKIIQSDIMYININLVLFLFNLLPIYPLDGSKLIILLLQSIGDLNKAMILSLKISILSLIIFSVFYLNLNTFIILMFLLFYQVVFYQFIKRYVSSYILQNMNNLDRKKFIHFNLEYRRGYLNCYMIDNVMYKENEIFHLLIKNNV